MKRLLALPAAAAAAVLAVPAPAHAVCVSPPPSVVVSGTVCADVIVAPGSVTVTYDVRCTSSVFFTLVLACATV